jgi:hypothetical protein
MEITRVQVGVPQLSHSGTPYRWRLRTTPVSIGDETQMLVERLETNLSHFGENTQMKVKEIGDIMPVSFGNNIQI